MNRWIRENLVCPRDKYSLKAVKNNLVCLKNHSYPIFDDVPIMLVDDVEETHAYISRTLEAVSNSENHNSKKYESQKDYLNENEIDKFVQGEIPYTSGNLYFSVQHKLKRYPIPNIRIPQGNGERLLDVGCNWGRWTIATAQKGYKPVGVDPSLDAILAARRVSKQLGVNADYIVGDARFLPFKDSSFDLTYSYSVLQHFSKKNAKISLKEISRVTKPKGKTFIQMPNSFGIRQYYNHWKRGFTEGKGFEVRYWKPSELLETFVDEFGETKMSVDCYFGLGIIKEDIDILPIQYKPIIYSSDFLKKLSKVLPLLIKVADSIYLESVNEK